MSRTPMVIARALLLAAGLAGAGVDSQPAAPAGLVAQPPAVVNSATAGQQVLQTVGSLADGGYAVGWISDDTTRFTQRYDRAGNRVGAETRSGLGAGAVSILAGGDVVVAYSARRDGRATGRHLIFIQRFGADGVRLQDETLVSSVEFASRRPSQLTDIDLLALADGGFVVGWTYQWVSSVDTGHTFVNQRFDARGQAVGSAFVAGSGDAVSNTEVATYELVADAHGGYVVAREVTERSGDKLHSVTHHGTGSAPRIPAMRSKVILLPLEGGKYVVFASNSAGAYRQSLDSEGHRSEQTPMRAMPVAARELSDGSYMVFWAEGDVRAQRFSAGGQAVGGLLAVRTGGAVPQVAPLADGGFALAWTAPGAGGDMDVFTQRFVPIPGRKTAGKQGTGTNCEQGAGKMKGRERRQFIDACLARQKKGTP